jgi:glycerol-3-phosphate dehydrogenase
MRSKDAFYDVAIIGAGVVGSAIAYELSRYEISCALLEANPDVGMGVSKANSAIWHTGFDALPGTLEARLLRRSYPLLEAFMRQSGVPFERLGALVIAWTPEEAALLPRLEEQAHQNGVVDVRLLSASEVYDLEPYLNRGAYGGLLVPGEGILCTYTLPLALATGAVLNGVDLRLNFPVQEIRREPQGEYHLEGPGGWVRCHYLINAAGLHADEIDRLLGRQAFTITPRRGEFIVFDKFARRLLRHILLPVPTPLTKGILIAPTVYGNVLLGPTAEDVQDKADTKTTAAGLRRLLEKGSAILPALLDEEVTAIYAGLRPATEHRDYQIHVDLHQRYICVGGIRSTGISASLGIAEHVKELLAESGLELTPKPDHRPVRMPNIGEAYLRPYQMEEMIAADPNYGRIVCYCERVTLGELLDAIHAPIPARTLDGLRRRTRALQGRCQGFHCHAAIARLLARETGQSLSFILGLEDLDALGEV